MKIFLISEELSYPYDEGIRNFAYGLIKELSKGNNVFALSIRGNKIDGRYIKKMGINRAFLSYSLFREIKKFNPEIVFYVPSPSATFFSFMRAKVLKLYARKAKVVMIALQPREYSFICQKLIPLMVPDLVLVQSTNVLRQLFEFGCCVKLIPSGVDLEKFRPVNREEKIILRKKYGIDSNKYVVLHVGHINRNRNIQMLKKLQSRNNQMVIVGSTSTEQDEELINELKVTGVRIIRNYLKKIQEIYQLSDCYIFPATSETASIEIPLSVLEAMACNLPIMTTRYGGLPTLFKEGSGLFFANDLNALLDKIEECKKVNSCETKKLVERYSWKNVTKKILDLVFSIE